jgi:hypothetical protein
MVLIVFPSNTSEMTQARIQTKNIAKGPKMERAQAAARKNQQTNKT